MSKLIFVTHTLSGFKLEVLVNRLMCVFLVMLSSYYTNKTDAWDHGSLIVRLDCFILSKVVSIFVTQHIHVYKLCRVYATTMGLCTGSVVRFFLILKF